MHDLVRESSRNLLEELKNPSNLLERPTGKNSTVSKRQTKIDVQQMLSTAVTA